MKYKNNLYYLNNKNYIYISCSDFNNVINLIDLYSLNNLYAKNSEGNIITPFYKYIYIINYLLMNIKHIKENLQVQMIQIMIQNQMKILILEFLKIKI